MTTDPLAAVRNDMFNVSLFNVDMGDEVAQECREKADAFHAIRTQLGCYRAAYGALINVVVTDPRLQDGTDPLAASPFEIVEEEGTISYLTTWNDNIDASLEMVRKADEGLRIGMDWCEAGRRVFAAAPPHVDPIAKWLHTFDDELRARRNAFEKHRDASVPDVIRDLDDLLAWTLKTSSVARRHHNSLWAYSRAVEEAILATSEPITTLKDTLNERLAGLQNLESTCRRTLEQVRSVAE